MPKTMDSKKRSKTFHTPKLLAEMQEHHRQVKSDMIGLLEKFNSPNYSKERLKDELFKIYMKVK